MVFFICEIGVGVAAYVYKKDVEDWIKTSMKTTIPNYNKTDYQAVTDTWDLVQPLFDCCGVDSYADWKEAPVLNNDVPQSCCIKEGCDTTGFATKRPDQVNGTIYTKGCVQDMMDEIKADIAIVGGVGIGIAVVQLVGSVVAFFLGRRMSQENQYA